MLPSWSNGNSALRPLASTGKEYIVLSVYIVSWHRWKYEKMTHLHCMAFRKTQMTRIDYSDVMSQHALLEIPQDKR